MIDRVVNNILYYIVLFSFTFSLIGCDFIENDEKVKYDYYFDTLNLFKESVKELSANNDTYTKIYFLNGKEDKRNKIDCNIENLEEELKILSEANINLPSFVDKYEVDTAWIMGEYSEEFSVKYKAKSNNLKVKDLNVIYDFNPNSENQELSSISSKISNRNFMNSYEKKLYYNVGTKLEVEGWHVSLFTDTVFYQYKLIL